MTETPLLVLGIESSCDETAAAIVAGDGRILSNVVLSQLDDHRAYGGVVPEIAARAHVSHLDGLIRRALDEAGVTLAEVDAIAATAGPGLIGGVIVGLTTAKALALGAGKPLIGINHLEGHALTPRLVARVPFPYLLLLVSGGHCQLLAVEGVGQYRRLGTTIDDAVGEAFDKTAKLLGLGYPGGPAVEQAALAGDPARFALPRPMIGRPGCDFSFSGLKTAVREAAAALPKPLSDQDKADLATSFQAVVGAVMVDRTRRAIALMPPGSPLVVAGGVAANKHLRARLEALAATAKIDFVAPPLRLCTDNAAMIAWAGIEHFRAGRTDSLDLKPRARWPLDAAAAAPGAKA